MTGPFPLMQLPKRVIYVDDDAKLLDILRMTMPREMSRAFHTTAEAAHQSLAMEADYWRGIGKVLARASDRRIDGLGEAELYVQSYFRDWRRFHLTGVLIVDYMMPGMNGLELLRRLGACPSRRVLLTGQADADVAVEAFNSGLIQKFIPKSTPNLYKELRRVADEMHMDVCQHLGQLLRPTLTDAQVELLHEPAVIQALWAKVVEQDWLEFVVVGEPFGLLGMSHDGPLQWLQLETKDSLRQLSLTAGELGFSEADASAIARAEVVPVGEMRLQLQLPDVAQLVPLDQLTEHPALWSAEVDLAMEVLTAAHYGLEDVRTPEEQMRALLRDVEHADRASGLRLSPDAEAGLRNALSSLLATAKLSKIHAQALVATLDSMQLPPAIAATINASLSSAGLKGVPGGH